MFSLLDRFKSIFVDRKAVVPKLDGVTIKKYLDRIVDMLHQHAASSNLSVKTTDEGVTKMSDHHKLAVKTFEANHQAINELQRAEEMLRRLITLGEPVPQSQASNKTHIVIHHSLTADSQTVSWDAIRRYHIDTNKYNNIGYHYGCELVGNYQEILIGRFEHENGAHCPQGGMNRVGIGICCVGNFDLAAPPKEQWDRCLDLCHHIMKRLNIPVENVKGHTEFNPAKSCPGKFWDMNKFRSELKAR